MIGIAFDVDNLRGDVLGAVADGVDDDAATHGAVRTGGASLAGASDLELAQFSVGRLHIEAKNGRGGTPNSCEFQEITTSSLHASSLSPSTKEPRAEVVNIAMAIQSQVKGVSNCPLFGWTNDRITALFHVAVEHASASK